MHIHFLGIGGTLMGNLALLAQEAGHRVTGSDTGIYPPMSEVLAAARIEAFEGFHPTQLNPHPDMVVIGNAGLPRGDPGVEYVLNHGIPYTSGAQWLGDEILTGRWVVGVSGTHGKTTTTSMVAWILSECDAKPGYLIGGVQPDLPASSRLGSGNHFVVEADEYDSSYFDRRSKFVHYRPKTLVINNLEWDHADIFEDLEAITQQFHNLLRTVPANGLVIVPAHDENVDALLKVGCWTPIQRFTLDPARSSEADWHAARNNHDYARFTIYQGQEPCGTVDWKLFGQHNAMNALGAVAATTHAGIDPALAIQALNRFRGVKRRLELIATIRDICIYDDFAHHPTAIRSTLQGLRSSVGSDEIVAVIEPRSHTMSLGALKDALTRCCAPADQSLWLRNESLRWDIQDLVRDSVGPTRIEDSVDALIEALTRMGDPSTGHRRHIVLMSNGSFGGIHKKLAAALSVEA